MYKILYLGDISPGSTSRHRALALERIGHQVFHIHPKAALFWNKWNLILHYRTGFILIKGRVRRYVLRQAQQLSSDYDIVWVDNGEDVSRQLLCELRVKYRAKLVNYNCDDPTGGRDGTRWLTFWDSISTYDLLVVVRKENFSEYASYGAKKILRVNMSADEVAHAPRLITPEIYKKWKSEVVFVGTWMPERGPFMLALLESGIPLSIWGERWHKAPEWPQLKACWRGPSLKGDEYAYAIQCAKISLGLLSKGNRDLHTTRSAEIPALGGLLCAEKTVEHSTFYDEDSEAVFWSGTEDCIRKIRMLLNDLSLCKSISACGHERQKSGPMRNESVVKLILETCAKEL